MSSHLLQCHAAEGNGFLLKTVTGDEKWFHHFDPKQNNAAWNDIMLHFQ
jgi:hypothetical protein